jgi:hypothetical protein
VARLLRRGILRLVGVSQAILCLRCYAVVGVYPSFVCAPYVFTAVAMFYLFIVK